MSLPKEILDQLLSGYLDDALSADERARIERLLETDPEVATQLEELRDLVGALKEVSKTDAGFKLPAGFADRVLDAAVASAASEGLSDEHPLVRLAEQPSSKRPHPTSNRRVAGVLVALAASIVIAVFAFRPDVSDVVIENTGVVVAPPADVPAVDEVPDVGPAVGPVDSPDVNRIAVAPVTNIKPNVPSPNDVAVDPAPAPEAVAVNDTPMVTPEIATPELVSQTPRSVVISEILVLHVKRTEFGRENEAVKVAMKGAGIDSASEKKISDDVVNLAKDESEAADRDAVVLYLQASAKSIDQFILSLVADRVGIESVRLALAEDAPTLDVAQAAQPVDATKIRHAGTWQLSSDSAGLIGAIAGSLEDRSGYLSIDPATAQVGAASVIATPKTNGPDIMSQVLILIR